MRNGIAALDNKSSRLDTHFFKSDVHGLHNEVTLIQGHFPTALALDFDEDSSVLGYHRDDFVVDFQG